MKMKTSFTVEITDEVSNEEIERIHTEEEIRAGIAELLLEAVSSNGKIAIGDLKVTYEQ